MLTIVYTIDNEYICSSLVPIMAHLGPLDNSGKLSNKTYCNLTTCTRGCILTLVIEIGRGGEAMMLTGRSARQWIEGQHPVTAQFSNSRIAVADIHVDAERFQFKLGTGSGGATSLLSNVDQWNPALAQGVMVWIDSIDKCVYVVNGHHRVGLARRLGIEYLTNPYYISAASASAARAIGALANIAEGHGTAIDAAKFFRDSGFTADEVFAKLPRQQRIVADGLSLSQLADGLFSRVVRGDLPMERGIIIGAKLADHTLQFALCALIERQGKTGHITNDVIAELADMVAGAPRVTSTQASLFGDIQIEQSFAVEKAGLLAYIKNRLSQDRRIFAVAAQHARDLERGGNIIDRDNSRNISDRSGQLLGLFDIIKNQVGPCATILDTAAMRMGTGENSNTVRGEAYEAIVTALQAIVTGNQGESVGSGSIVSEAAPATQMPMFG